MCVFNVDSVDVGQLYHPRLIVKCQDSCIYNVLRACIYVVSGSVKIS